MVVFQQALSLKMMADMSKNTRGKLKSLNHQFNTPANAVQLDQGNFGGGSKLPLSQVELEVMLNCTQSDEFSSSDFSIMEKD